MRSDIGARPGFCDGRSGKAVSGNLGIPEPAWIRAALHKNGSVGAQGARSGKRGAKSGEQEAGSEKREEKWKYLECLLRF